MVAAHNQHVNVVQQILDVLGLPLVPGLAAAAQLVLGVRPLENDALVRLVDARLRKLEKVVLVAAGLG